VWTCYKAFRAEVLSQIDLREDRFGFEVDITSKVARGWLARPTTAGHLRRGQEDHVEGAARAVCGARCATACSAEASDTLTQSP